METVQDFEDLLQLLGKHRVRYLIIGGLAFIYHAKPRYTKDMDLWVDPSEDNVKRANIALAEFGSRFLLNPDKDEEILQLGVPLIASISCVPLKAPGSPRPGRTAFAGNTAKPTPTGLI